MAKPVSEALEKRLTDLREAEANYIYYETLADVASSSGMADSARSYRSLSETWEGRAEAIQIDITIRFKKDDAEEGVNKKLDRDITAALNAGERDGKNRAKRTIDGLKKTDSKWKSLREVEAEQVARERAYFDDKQANTPAPAIAEVKQQRKERADLRKGIFETPEDPEGDDSPPKKKASQSPPSPSPTDAVGGDNVRPLRDNVVPFRPTGEETDAQATEGRADGESPDKESGGNRDACPGSRSCDDGGNGKNPPKGGASSRRRRRTSAVTGDEMQQFAAYPVSDTKAEELGQLSSLPADSKTQVNAIA